MSTASQLRDGMSDLARYASQRRQDASQVDSPIRRWQIPTGEDSIRAYRT